MLHDFYRQQELHQEKKYEEGIPLEELRTKREKKERKLRFKRMRNNIDKLRDIFKEL